MNRCLCCGVCVPVEVLLSPEVVLTSSHVVTQTVLKKYGGLFGIGLELQHRSAPSSPSRLHSSQSSKLLERHEKLIGAGFTQRFFFYWETGKQLILLQQVCQRKTQNSAPLENSHILHTLLHACILIGRSKVRVVQNKSLEAWNATTYHTERSSHVCNHYRRMINTQYLLRRFCSNTYLVK